jgi:penicillin-binding protein 2
MRRFRSNKPPVEFDEIFMDASNLPSFNQARLEGRMELPIRSRSLFAVGALFLVISLIFFGRLFQLQVIHGAEYRERSDRNRIDEALIIAERGVLYDRQGELLAWNEHDANDAYDFPVRAYTDRLGLGQIVGYVSYPQKDQNGFYYRTDYVGRNGLEAAFEETLHGENGTILVEEDAAGEVIAASATRAPQPGAPMTTSIDAELSEAMYNIIATSSAQAEIRSGAAVIMDIHTGEIIGMTSFPSYDPEVMADGDDLALIQSYEADERFPFLNKVVGGAYIPGSVVKPFVAYAALAEDTVDPAETFVSTGEIVIPNPYNPANPSIFRDWRAHGVVDMRRAIAYSSNVYFYIIGGGFEDQAGLGITAMHRYFTHFGLGSPTEIVLENEQAGVVPSPAWKEEVFNDEWRLGDTYFTAIGQYGFLVTPLQLVRAYAALANGGALLTPHVVAGEASERQELNLDPEHLKVVHEGMRMTVNTDGGTARSLERSDVAIAAKSGTAELDFSKTHLNSWAAGFWPYEEPRYAFTLLMEHAPYENELGATRVMGDVIEWMSEHRPEYLGISAED